MRVRNRPPPPATAPTSPEPTAGWQGNIQGVWRVKSSPRALLEQLVQPADQGLGQFVGVGDGERAAVIARNVVADADRGQLDRRVVLDPLDDVAQILLENVGGVD